MSHARTDAKKLTHKFVLVMKGHRTKIPMCAVYESELDAYVKIALWFDCLSFYFDEEKDDKTNVDLIKTALAPLFQEGSGLHRVWRDAEKKLTLHYAFLEDVHIRKA